jgi:hypothetical protein
MWSTLREALARLWFLSFYVSFCNIHPPPPPPVNEILNWKTRLFAASKMSFWLLIKRLTLRNSMCKNRQKILETYEKYLMSWINKGSSEWTAYRFQVAQRPFPFVIISKPILGSRSCGKLPVDLYMSVVKRHLSRVQGLLMMAWDFALCPSSSILRASMKPGSLPVLRCEGWEKNTLFGPLESDWD